MSPHWPQALISVTLVSFVSFVGLVTLALSDKLLKRVVFFVVSLAVGAMLGDAFIHLLPEAYARAENTRTCALWALAGVFGLFVLEKFLHWGHAHGEASEKHIHPVGYMCLLADSLHNLLDGLLIGASYLISVRLGIATTLAILFHEIPQEIGHYGILLHAGFSRQKALFFNVLAASAAILGTLIALIVGERITGFVDFVVPLAAGGFIYLAAADLIPELHKERKARRSAVQLAAIFLGIALMLLLSV